MSEPMAALYIFVLACFIGYWVVWGVTPSLHTPLISLTNAISGIVVVGAILVSGIGDVTGGASIVEGGVSDPTRSFVVEALGFLAVLLTSINIFGGFLVTGRMLAMFKKKREK